MKITVKEFTCQPGDGWIDIMIKPNNQTLHDCLSVVDNLVSSDNCDLSCCVDQINDIMISIKKALNKTEG